MSDTRYAEAMRRVFAVTADVLNETNAALPLPRYPLRKRILWKLRGVPADVRAHERRIARARAEHYFDAMSRARDTLTGSSDE